MYVTIILNKKKAVFGGGLIIFTALILFFSISKMPLDMVETTTNGEREVPIYYVETPEKKVAFSFDASWGAEKTPRILEILDQHEIKTTFFVTSYWIEEYPEKVKEIVKKGHELGNHTSTHPHMSRLSENEIRQEVLEVEEEISELTGFKTALFRPPFGDYNNTVISTLEEMDYQVIQWSIDSLDWKNLSKEAIIERVTGRDHRGAIVLFHNDGLYTPDALPDIIEYYQENGYEIIPVSQLVYEEDYEIDPHTGAQRPTQ